MRRFGVNLITSEAYYEVEAENEDEAIEVAYELLYNERVSNFYWDCNEVVELAGN